MKEQRVWFAFILLALAWGTSFMFIKIALETLQPLTLVSFRLLIGWVGLVLIAAAYGMSWPRGWRIWGHFTLMGLFNTAVPFALITWAEFGPAGIDSGVASVLNATVPLFSIVLAGLVLRTEPFTPGRVAGLLVGFVGVALLLSRSADVSSGGVIQKTAVILAAFCYALSSSYARRYLQGLHPVIVAGGQLLVANLIVGASVLLFEDLAAQSFPLMTIGSLLWLGLLGSCLAYILYFYVLQEWGATRTTLVPYLLPVVGVSAGVVFLGELLDWRLLVGGLLVLSGVGVVNWRPRRIAAASMK
jgi:drug/metabolite transporter (DMT)-like permease